MSYSKEEIKDKFKNLFKEDRELLMDISPFCEKSPSNDQALVFEPSYTKLSLLVDQDILDFILENAEEGLAAVEAALEEEDYKSYFGYTEEDDITVGIKDLPEPYIKEIREIREEDIGRYIGIKGIVRRCSKVLHLPKVIPFKCSRCKGRTVKPQEEDSYKIEKPRECSGCGKYSSSSKVVFKPIKNKIKWEDFQELKITERQRDLQIGEQSRDKKAILRKHLVDQVNLSDDVILHGIYKARFKEKSSIPKTYLDVKSIEVINKDFSEVELEEEEEEKVKELAEDPDIFDKIVRSINPSIKGLRSEKESVALQLFGGVRKNQEDNYFRGDIHILLAGDPETGKSQILDYVSKIAPKGILGSGRGSTGVGLTASVTQEEIAGESQWVLDPGILPLADGGLAAIDEFDKMRSEDRDTIHRALEQQDVRIDKASVHQTLNSRCPVLAAANPDLGRFDKSDLNNPEKKLIEEIKIKPDLRSRFDYIWIITGVKKEEEQKELADHITKLHEELGKRKKNPERKEESDFKPPLTKEELKNYIKKAKEIIPTWKEGPRREVRNFYINLTKNLDIGPRTLESLIRSAEASARLHFREELTLEDVDKAVRLKEEQLKRAKELDLLYTGYSQSDRTKLKEVRDLIRTLEDNYPDKIIPENKIISAAENDGLEEEEVREELEKMEENGLIFYPEKGGVKFA